MNVAQATLTPQSDAKKAGAAGHDPSRHPPQGRGLADKLMPVVIWTCILAAVLFVGAAFLRGGADTGVAAILGAGAALVAVLIGLATTSRAYSPMLLAGLLWRRRLFLTPTSKLAGREVVEGLGLAQSIVDCDADARLVTRRDGVVVYANDQYMNLSRSAGVVGVSGLPPRIDRLFGQARSESSKMFRLARAARSGQPAEEIIGQVMALAETGEPVLRRFEVSARPMGDPGKHVSWRLREIEVEDAHDALKAAYAHYPRPVIALEKSGNLTWANAAAFKLIGAPNGTVLALGDFVLGEWSDVAEALWEDEPEEVEGRLKAPGDAPPISAIFTAFTRGGVGQGFVCVEMLPKAGMIAEAKATDLASDNSEAPFGVAVAAGDVGSDAILTSVNRLFADAFGAESDMRLSEALPQAAVRDLVAALRSKSANQSLTLPVEVVLGEGPTARIFRVYCRPIKRRRGAYGPRQTVLYAVDVSLQKRMEEDHAHDNRLKAIGKISGSVAHDFNNFLQAILGATEFLMRRHPAGDPSYADLVTIREIGQRARNLTQNLLAFSRKQTLQSEVLFVTDFLADFGPFVQRYVTEKVKVELDHGRNVPPVKADKGQLELAIMNLAVNARDAMEKGGTVTISSKRVPADEVEDFGYAVLDPVDYALIEISDTGTGVPEDIAENIFEPFFTTKGEGKGTGLGLSTVHGVIGQMGGRIFLHNRPGEGATFRIFLPAVSDEVAEEVLANRSGNRAKAPVDDLTGKGRILIVEDEAGVRNIVVRALAMCGYEIVEASDGCEALEMIEDDDTPFDVVLSDIMMPEMDGPTLIQEAGDKLQGAKVIFMSGYAEEAMRDKLDAIDGAAYLQKPFTLKKIAATVKDAMTA